MTNRYPKFLFNLIPENNKIERIWLLAHTDFKKRYYGSSLGIIWALINPIIQLLIFYYVFSVFFKTEIANFPLYIFLGLIIWMFFAETTKKGLTLINEKRYLIENIRINKLDIFSSSILSNILALLFNLLVFIIVSFFFKISYGINMFYFLIILINLIILVFGLILILSVVFIYLRDFEHFWDILLLAAFWANPIVYQHSVLFENKIILYLNPLAGIIVNSHNCLLYETQPDFQILLLNIFQAIIIFGTGLLVFKRHSKKIIEIL